MKILYLTTDVGCITFTSLYSLYELGIDVTLMSLSGTKTKTSDYYTELCRPFCRMRESIDGIESRSYDTAVVKLVVDKIDYSTQRKIVDSAKNLTVITPDLPLPTLSRIKSRISYLKNNWYLFLKRPRVTAYDAPNHIDPLCIGYRSKSTFPIDVHHKFLCDDKLQEKMFQTRWELNANRKYLVNFVGAPNSSDRVNALNASRLALESAGISFKNLEACVWLEATSATPGLDANAFCDVLLQSQFTLCPSGTSPWSHHIVEALLCGSIPVLSSQALSICDLPLRSGHNCIVAQHEDWSSAVQVFLAMSHAEVVAMRSNILSLIQQGHLEPSSVAKRTCVALLGKELQ